jgi:hypothetical protein
MLLGEEDFLTLMANPRGKQRLHNAWLHGTGVVHGMDVRKDGTRNLKVLPGLCLDGAGPELYQDCTATLDVRDLLDAAKIREPTDPKTGTVTADLVAEFKACPAHPVPVLADPCDVTRQHDGPSRILEQVRYKLRTRTVPAGQATPAGYHRIRVLLGLAEVLNDHDDAGHKALDARQRVANSPPGGRAMALLREFRLLAVEDEIDLQPVKDSGHCYPTLFPVEEGSAGVVLATVVISMQSSDITIQSVDTGARSVLLPSAVIQELVCGLAPALIGTSGTNDGDGPRVDGEAELSEDGRQLSFAVTDDVLPASLRRAIAITSLSDRGWVEEDIDTVSYDAQSHTVVIKLADRPINEIVRLIVRGTGPTPVYGVDPPVPLAGRVGGPPGTVDNGHDAVLTFRNPLTDRRAEA